MEILGILLWFIIVPLSLGLPIGMKLKKERKSITEIYVIGMLSMMALFQLIYVFFICFHNKYLPLQYSYLGVVIILSVISVIRYRNYIWKECQKLRQSFQSTNRKGELSYYIMWLIVIIVIGFQLWKTFRYQFVDGDDAFYAATSVVTDRLETMYIHLPYTGGSSALDFRHAFSAAPIFTTFLGRMTNLHPTIIHHSVLPLCLIICTYSIFAQIAKNIYQDKNKIPLFLIFINTFYLFGNTTIYTNATFMLTRTAQGKSILANFVFPFAFLILTYLWNAKKNGKLEKLIWPLISLLMLLAGFTSMMAIVLTPLILGLGILILSIYKKTPSYIYKFILSILPCVLLALMYVLVCGK